MNEMMKNQEKWYGICAGGSFLAVFTIVMLFLAQLVVGTSAYVIPGYAAIALWLLCALLLVGKRPEDRQPLFRKVYRQMMFGGAVLASAVGLVILSNEWNGNQSAIVEGVTSIWYLATVLAFIVLTINQIRIIKVLLVRCGLSIKVSQFTLFCFSFILTTLSTLGFLLWDAYPYREASSFGFETDVMISVFAGLMFAMFISAAIQTVRMIVILAYNKKDNIS